MEIKVTQTFHNAPIDPDGWVALTIARLKITFPNKVFDITWRFGHNQRTR